MFYIAVVFLIFWVSYLCIKQGFKKSLFQIGIVILIASVLVLVNFVPIDPLVVGGVFLAVSMIIAIFIINIKNKEK